MTQTGGMVHESKKQEGKKLRAMLDASRYDQKTLADAIGVTKAAVGKWCKRDTFTDPVWTKIKRGLKALGLKPGDIRNDEREGPKPPREDLTALVRGWPKAHIVALQRILEVTARDDVSRDILLGYVNGVLNSNQ